MSKYENINGALIFQNIFFDVENGALTTPVETQNYTVIQVADSYYLSDFEIKNHTQYCDLEVTFVTFGNLTCVTDGIIEKLKKNEIYLSFKGDVHSLYSKSSTRFQTLAINVKSGSPSRSMLGRIWQSFASLDDRKASQPKLAAFLTAIISEFLTADQPFAEQVIDASITAVLAELARGDMHPSAIPRETPEKLLSNVIDYIDQNFLSIKTLQEVSERLGYSHGYLCRLFKQTHGMTMQAYLLQRKMRHGAEALQQGRRVSEIAEELGYQNLCNFSRAFKKYYGTSPKYFAVY